MNVAREEKKFAICFFSKINNFPNRQTEINVSLMTDVGPIVKNYQPGAAGKHCSWRTRARLCPPVAATDNN